MSPDTTFKKTANGKNAENFLFCAMDFRFATDDAVKSWFQEGGLSNWVAPTDLLPSRFIHELTWRVVLGDLPAKQVPSILQAAGLTAEGVRNDTAYSVGDSLMVVDAEMDCIAGGKAGEGVSEEEVAATVSRAQAGKQKLKDMANELVLAEVMTVRELAQVAETDFLVEGGYTFTKQPQYKNKMVRTNTKLMYTQTRFNLLAEESEGYAKVATLLGQEGTITEASLEDAKRNIWSLIGFFDLDPHRVLDIVMDSLEMNPGYSVLLKVISSFNLSGRAQVLGFKFQYYQREQVTQATPQTLYRLAGRLIKEDLVDINALWPHLAPGDEEGVEEYQSWFKERVAEANRYGVVNLAQTEATGAEAEQVAPVSQTVDVSRPAAFEEEGVKEQEEKLSRHQKLGLLEGLLHADDWPRAQMVIERLSGLAPLAWPPVAKALCRALTLNIAPFFARTKLPYLSGKKNGPPVVVGDDTQATMYLSEAVTVPARVINMLLTLGPYLYRDAPLFTKVCRSLRAHILTAAYGFPLPIFHVSTVYGVVADGNVDACTPALQNAIRTAATVLEKVLLPALMMTPANPAMSFEVQDVLKLLPYELRYELYGTWDSVGAVNSPEESDKWLPMLVFARKFANVETRKILRRVADIKDKAFQQHQLLLNKLTHANPVVTLSSIVKQMENYTAMIPAAITAFRGLNQLEHEIVEYLILQALAQKRERLKDSGLDIADWLQHLAEFVGSWGKKHHHIINLHGILQMMVKQAINAQPWDLVILQEMLGQMANVRVVEDTQEDLQEAMAGGEKLYFEAFNIGSMKLTKLETKTVNKALVKLKETLYPSPDDAPRLAMPLLIGIAQLRNRILYEADPFSLPTPNVKVTGGQYDMLHKIFIQLFEYLVKAVPEAEFATLVLPLNELVHSYYLEPEVAMLIYRPVLQDLKLKPAPKLLRPAEPEGETPEKAVGAWTTDPKDDDKLAVELGDFKLTWKNLLTSVQSFHAPPAWNIMSPLLYLRFWSLSLSDIYVPKARYVAEIEKVQKAAKDAAKEAETLTGSDQKKRDREAKFLRDTAANLETELAAQQKTVEAVKQILVQEREQWVLRNRKAVTHGSPDRSAISDFFQVCLFPRVTLSLPDALFCFQFLKLLHEINAPGFLTLQIIANLVVKLCGPLIALCSEYEAVRYGKFLGKVFKLLHYWKSDEETFKQECSGAHELRIISKEGGGALSFPEYQEQLYKWHQWLVRHIMRHLDSKDPMRIRNSLVILKELKDTVPATKKHSRVFETRLEKLINEKETTEDILIIARSYKAILTMKKNQGQLLMAHVFNPRLEPPPVREPTPASAKSRQPSPLPLKASPLGPSRPSSGQPSAMTGVTTPTVGKKEGAPDVTTGEQLAKPKPSVNGVAKDSDAGDRKVELSPARAADRGGASPSRATGREGASPSRATGREGASPGRATGREEKPAPGSRLNPNAPPFAPKDEPKAKAGEKDAKADGRKAKPVEKKSEAPKLKTEPKIDDDEQEEGEISATPDRKHEPEFEEEHRSKASDVQRTREGEKVPLGKLLAEANRRGSASEKGPVERTGPRPPTRKDRRADDVKETRVREDDVSRARDGDGGKGGEATKGVRESGDHKSIPRSDSKDGLKDGVGSRVKEPTSVNPPGFPLRSRPASAVTRDDGKPEKEKADVPVSNRLGTLKESRKEGEGRSSETGRGLVREDVESRETRKVVGSEAPSAPAGPKADVRQERGLGSRAKVDDAEAKRGRAESRIGEKPREVIDARTKPLERKVESIERMGSGVTAERKREAEERKPEERRLSKIISLSGRARAVREEGELLDGPEPDKHVSTSPADRRSEDAGKRDRADEGAKRDRGKRPAKDDRELRDESERDRKRHKHDSDAHLPEQRQVVRSLGTVDQHRRIAVDDDHRRIVLEEDRPARRVLLEEPQRRGALTDRIRSSVEEPRRYEDRGRTIPDEEGRRGVSIQEVLDSRRTPSTERERLFRGSVEMEERHRRREESPVEMRRTGGDGDRARRSFSPHGDRGGGSGLLDRVEGGEETARLRAQLLKKQMERTGQASAAPRQFSESSRRRVKSDEHRSVVSVAAMELGEDLAEGPSRPPRNERHHRHDSKYDKGQEKVRGHGHDDYDGEESRKKRDKAHGKRRRYD